MAQHRAMIAQLPVGQLVFIVVAVLFVLWRLAVTVTVGRLLRLWLQSVLAGAPVSVAELLAMRLRKVPAQEIVRLRVMAVQSGVPLTTAQLETAYLRGANVERAVLALIRARETGQQVTWEELLSTDLDQRCENAGSSSIARS